MPRISGAEIIVRSLTAEGVKHIFGYPGGAVIPLFDELYGNEQIQFILPRHEQGGAHAADGYARATGKVGVCIGTSGPGATNLVTGIATAYLDSVPLVVFTGQVVTNMIGNDAFQEVDITGITRPITKHNFLVKDVKNLAQTIKDAFYIARTGRPGPVLIDLPSDVQKAAAEFKYPVSSSLRSYKPTMDGNPAQIKRGAAMIMKAKKPVVYAGGGVIISDASKELREFVDKTGIPVTTTLLGLGVYPENKKLALHMLGMHGTQYANIAISECDLIIAVGARFDDRVTGKLDEFSPHAKIIHIDIDPTSIGKSIAVDVPIVGDVKSVLKVLNKQVSACEIGSWVSHVTSLKKKFPLTYEKSKTVVKPQEIMEEVDKQTGGKAVIVSDVGQHQMWAAQFYQYRNPRSYIGSGGLGTMGYGFPAGMGACLGKPSSDIVVITGDGGFQMNLQELATVSLYNIPVKVIIFNNGFLGMVRQWQDLFYDKRYAATFLQGNQKALMDYRKDRKSPVPVPDFVKLAESYNVKAMRVNKPAELASAVKKTLAHKGPFVLDVQISPEENVFPMVPAGKPLTAMLA